MTHVFDRHRATVLPGWIDYNGHMNEAYYVLVFSEATDTLIDHLGFDAACRAVSGRTVYTAEAHVTYRREVGVGQPLRVTSQILDLDARRVHLFHRMLGGESETLASHELVTLCVDTGSKRVVPWPEAVFDGWTALFEAQRATPRPEEAGRVGLRRGTRSSS